MAKARNSVPDVELNMWCVEMAMAWPVVSFSPQACGNALGGLPIYSNTPQKLDADVIGRAEKIRKWVTGT